MLDVAGYNYAKVRRWSKKQRAEIILLDKVFIPYNISNTHWTLAVINFQQSRFEYYDSLHGQPPHNLFINLRRYVKDEAATHSSLPDYDLSEWTEYTPGDIPAQDNGYDCGVFICKFADYLSENLDLDFTQRDTPYFRDRMVLELTEKRVE